MRLAFCIFLIFSNLLSSITASSSNRFNPKKTSAKKDSSIPSRPRQQSLIAKSSSSDSLNSFGSTSSESSTDDSSIDTFHTIPNKRRNYRSRSSDSDSSYKSSSSGSDRDLLTPIPGINPSLFALDSRGRVVMFHKKARHTPLDSSNRRRQGIRYSPAEHEETLNLLQIALFGTINNEPVGVDRPTCWVPSQLHREIESGRAARATNKSANLTPTQRVASNWFNFNYKDTNQNMSAGKLAQYDLEASSKVYLKTKGPELYHNPHNIPQCSALL